MTKTRWIRITVVFVAIVLIILTVVCGTLNPKAQTNLLSLRDYQFKGRTAIFSGNDMTIGEDKSQIENGYWDFKFAKLSDNEIRIYINKLWYGTYEDTILDKNYLNELIEYIKFIAQSSDLEIEDINLLYSQIEADYLNIKCVEDNIEKILEYSVTSDGTCLRFSKVVKNE